MIGANADKMHEVQVGWRLAALADARSRLRTQGRASEVGRQLSETRWRNRVDAVLRQLACAKSCTRRILTASNC